MEEIMENQQNNLSFKKIFWPIFLSVILSGFVFSIILLLGVFGFLSFFDEEPLELEPNTILHLELDGVIMESSKTEFDAMNMSMTSQIGLSDIIYGLDKASKDENVSGLYIDFGNINCGMATAEEIRNAIIRFKNSGKFVLAYNSGEYISQKAYYISSAANEIYAFPDSYFQWTGLGGEVVFLKGLLDKLDIELQMFRGKDNDFKSAVEPLFRTSMSDSSRLQTERYLNSMWSDYLTKIAGTRKLKKEKLNQYANNLVVRNADDAYKRKLIDGLKYKDQIDKILMKKVHAKEVKDLVFYNFGKYCKRVFLDEQEFAQVSEPNIAVIVAEGGISVGGEGISSTKICKYFSEVRNNPDIKVVVFRVNSPGGSALASEEIWREVHLTNKVKKVIVSMGDVAASGGYYVASPAHKIFADPMTITGSIGVFGVFPYTGKMFKNKLGINFDYVATNEHSVLSINRKLSDEELKITQQEVNAIYDQFLMRVSQGRGLSIDSVNTIARGRVWTGSDAKKIGLIDEIGGMNDALGYAKKFVKDEPMTLYYPKVKKNKVEQLLQLFEEEDAMVSSQSKSVLQNAYLLEIHKKMKLMEQYSGIQMRLPYEISIE